LWVRDRRGYVGLFVLSVPLWWLFELINLRTQNWVYLGRAAFSDQAFAFWSSLSFATVVPAVFGTAELLSTFPSIVRIGRGRPVRPSLDVLFVFGVVSLLAFLVWPRYFFPFVWVSLFLIIDPVNARRGAPSILAFLRDGEWRPVVSLGLAGLVCGFFWEFWNVYAYPKWIYEIPYLEFWHVFEMPLAGYGGYIPFALELFALYHLIVGKRAPLPGLTGTIEPAGSSRQPSAGLGPAES